MSFYLKGKVTYIGKDYISLDVNNIGYFLYVSKPENYAINESYLLYIYTHKREDDEYLVGLSSLKEKDTFISLISVTGIGPKTALSILSKASPKEIEAAVLSNNLYFLRKLPNVGYKGASQILLDLGNKTHKLTSSKQQDEVKEVLKSLGFKIKEIEKILSTILIPNLSNEELLKEALKRLNSQC